MEELGRWAAAAVQWRLLLEVLLVQDQCTWEQGRVRYRAQEEAAKLWAKEGGQSIGIACWHVRVLEQAARRDLHTQAQQMWARIAALEGPARVTSQTMGSFLGAERAGPEEMRGRAMVFLLMEAAMARREQGRLSEQPGRGREDPPEQGGWRYKDVPEDAVLLTPAPVRPRTSVPEGPQMPAESPPQQPDLAADLFEIFLNCSTEYQDSKDTGHHK